MNRLSLAGLWNLFFVIVAYGIPIFWISYGQDEVIQVLGLIAFVALSFAAVATNRSFLGWMARAGTWWKAPLYLIGLFYLGGLTVGLMALIIRPEEFCLENLYRGIASPLIFFVYTLPFSGPIFLGYSLLFGFVLRFIYARRDYLPETL